MIIQRTVFSSTLHSSLICSLDDYMWYVIAVTEDKLISFERWLRIFNSPNVDAGGWIVLSAVLLFGFAFLIFCSARLG